MNNLGSFPLYFLVAQTDTVSKIILIILAILSVVCCTFFIILVIALKRKKKDIQAMRIRFEGVRTLDEMRNVSMSSTNLGGYVVAKSLLFFKSLLESRAPAQREGYRDYVHERMQAYLDQITDDILTNEESYLPLFSTSASVAPLLGLFGTVWGLIQSFIAIGAQQSADIAIIAPGIAQALITTLAGLVVAIPALVMYNYLSVQIRSVEHQLIQLTEQTQTVIQTLLPA